MCLCTALENSNLSSNFSNSGHELLKSMYQNRKAITIEVTIARIVSTFKSEKLYRVIIEVKLDSI